MSENVNPLGDLATVFANLDNPALQSLIDQANRVLTERRNANALEVFSALGRALHTVGHQEKDETECTAYRDRAGRMMGIRVVIPMSPDFKAIENFGLWSGVLETLTEHTDEFDLLFRFNASVRQAVVSFGITGLPWVPCIPTNPPTKNDQAPSLSMILEAYQYTEDNNPANAAAPVADSMEQTDYLKEQG